MIILQSIRKSLRGLKRVIDSDTIEFYCHPDLFDVIPHPVPAYKAMAPWYRKLKPHVDVEDPSREGRDPHGARGLTAKRCMPMLDAMSAGWTIPLFGDVNIRTNEENTLIDTGPNGLGSIVERHPAIQAGKDSPSGELDIIKFINPWIIRTPKGVSCMFIPPVNHFDRRFTCLTGLVDTDKYAGNVNFPAVWHLANFDDLLKAGTPLVTVIPVHRDKLAQRPKVRIMSPEEAKEKEILNKKQISRRSVYSQEIREPRK